MTGLDLWTYGVVGATLALYVGIAIWARTASAAALPPALIGMAAAADWISAAAVISLGGVIAVAGHGGSAFLLGWTGGYVLLAFLLAPYLRASGRPTLPAFIGDRYESRAARFLTILCVLLIALLCIAGQIIGLGVVFGRLLGVPYATGVFAGLALLALAALPGAFTGIVYTQIAQYVVMLFACTVLALLLALGLTGEPLPWLGLGGTLTGTAGVPLLAHLDRIVTELGFAPHTTGMLGGPLNLFALTLSLMLGTAALPHVIARLLAVPRVAAVRYAAGWTLLFGALIYLSIPAVGAMTRLQLIDSFQTGPVGAPDGNLAYAARPDWFRRWEQTGLLVFTDRNRDGRIQYYDDRNPDFAAQAGAFGWQGNELTTLNPDLLTLASPEIAGLPPWVAALMLAGGLAAALAASAGLLLAIASALAHDLLRGLLRPRLAARNLRIAERLAMLLALALAGLLALYPPGGAAETVALACGLAAATLFPALLLAIFDLRMNRAGVISGLLAGLGFTLLYLFQHQGILFIPGTAFLMPELGLGANWLFGITPAAGGAIGALVNLLAALGISRLTAPPSARLRLRAEALRIPRRADAAASGH